MDVVQEIAIWFLPILLAITLHEVAHGLVAYWFGDLTAKKQKRLTLNPVNHIDLIGTIIVPLTMLLLSGIIFGWAKPVPVDERNFKNPRTDMAFVAMAGPIANLIMAILWAGLIKISLLFLTTHAWAAGFAYMGKAGVFINLLLFVFNLFPIPPLDGSKVVLALLPTRLAIKYQQLDAYGFIILLLLIVLGLGRLIGPPLFYVQDLVLKIFNI